MTRMTQDEWVAARTNNPDRLGKDVWNDAYKQFRNENLHGIAPKIPLKTEIEMLKDFLEKNGCETEGIGNITRDAMLYILRNIDQDFEKKEVNPEKIQSLCAQTQRLQSTLPTSNAKIAANSGRD